MLKLLDKRQPLPSKSRFHQWEEISASEIKAFIAVEIGMGLLHKPTLASYFSDGFFLTLSPGFGELFTRNRYQLIRSFLHFSDNEADKSEDRLYKIRPIFDIVSDLYTSLYKSNREVSVD